MKYLLAICSCLFFFTVHAQHPLQRIAVKSVEGKILSAGKGLTAFVFLSPDCPLSQNYTLVLNNIQQEKKERLQVIGVFPGVDHTGKEIASFRKKYSISFALAQDKKDALVKYTGATITPEVFLYDASGKLLYKGAIDDWVISLGKKKREAEQHYLRDAIDNFLQHKAIYPSETKATGCYINNQ